MTNSGTIQPEQQTCSLSSSLHLPRRERDSSVQACHLSSSLHVPRRERRVRHRRGREHRCTPAAPPLYPAAGRRPANTTTTTTATITDGLLMLEMDEQPSEEIFPQAVGDDLVGATTTTIAMNSTNPSAHSTSTFNDSTVSSMCLTFASETPLTPPDYVRNRSRNIEGVPPSCISLDHQSDEELHNSGISLPGAYSMQGRPIGWVTQQEQSSQRVSNHSDYGPRPRLNLDDRMSSRTFEWWLRSQCDEDEEEQAMLNDEEQMLIDDAKFAVLNASVRRCSPNCGDDRDLDFTSIPPELRPVKSAPETLLTMKHKQNASRTSKLSISPKKISPKKIITKIMDAL